MSGTRTVFSIVDAETEEIIVSFHVQERALEYLEQHGRIFKDWTVFLETTVVTDSIGYSFTNYRK